MLNLSKGNEFMDWNVVWQDIISGGALLILGAIVGWIGGCFKGKKKSSINLFNNLNLKIINATN